MSDESNPSPRSLVRRRRANAAGGRQHSHKVRVTPEEELALVRLAEAQHVTVPRLLVESALHGAGTQTEQRQLLTELYKVRRLLANATNNVNQMARHANAGLQFEADVAPAMREVREVVDVIDSTLRRYAIK